MTHNAFNILYLPRDVMLSICGPSTLRILRSVFRAFCACLDEGPSIWRAARRNVLFDVALPPSGPSESSLAHLMFGVGACLNCRRPTSVMPHSFALAIRLCSFTCQYASLKKTTNNANMPYNFPSLVHVTTLPAALPYLEGSAASPLYLPAHISASWVQFFALCKVASEPLMPQITPTSQIIHPSFTEWMETTEKLVECSHAYREAKSAIDAKHEALIRQLASEHGYCLEQILTSPTLTRHVNAFASDLGILDPAVWESIKPVVLEEIRIRMPNANGRTPCPFCISNGRPRLFSSHALRQHFESSHGEHMAEQIVVADIRCSLCPRSDRKYNPAALNSHLRNHPPY
ncbi:hypothetical protein B0H13DRAFT_2574208 [Mycena leptocephala]|nr:hypothetical protein B0H13DRAFT_2574208 [Mycena leptocephala]